MKSAVRSLNLSICVLLALAMGQGALGATIQEEIENLLSEAQMALKKADADERIDRAQSLLQRQQTVDENERPFLAGRIDRERAAIYLKFWQRDKQQTAWRDEAYRILQGLLSRYDRLYREWDAKAQQRAKGLNNRQRKNDSQYRTLNINMGRVRYEMAWTQYYLSIATDSSSDRREFLKSAAEKFHDLTSQGYRAHPTVAEAFYGHGLCLYRMAAYDDFNRLISKLDADKVSRQDIPAHLYKQITRLRIRASLAASDPFGADRFASEYFGNLGEKEALDDAELDMAIAWAVSVADITASLDQGQGRQSSPASFTRACELVRAAGEPWRSRLARALGDSKLSTGVGHLHKARESFAAKDYEAAVAEAEAGLKAPLDAAVAEDTHAELHYVRFAALWNLSRWRDAHLAGVEFLKQYAGDPRAEDVCSRAVRSGLNALCSDPSITVLQFLENLGFAEKQFPAVADVPEARRRAAEVLIGKGQLRDAEKILRTISSDSPTYCVAQFYLASVLCKQSMDIGLSGSDRKRAGLAESAAALIRFADSAVASLSQEGAPSPATITNLAAAVVAELLKLDPPDPNLAIRLLDAIRAIPQITDGEGRLLALRLEAKTRSGDVDAAVTLIASLSAEQMAARHVAEACLRIVDELEVRAADLAERGENAEAERINLQVIRIFELLLDQAGQSKEDGVRSWRLRLRLADTLVRLGRYEEAIGYYTRVADNSPEHAGTAIRGLAMAHACSGKYDMALPWWQTLYARTRTRTPGWLEASYHCILCQLRAGQTQDAGKRMAYFRLESEGMDLGQWTSKFEALENDCSKANPSGGS